jgi:WD40-like Beta Propeller Repeat
MRNDEHFAESVRKWLEESAPARIPERVLNATFDRTRASKQHVSWRALQRSTQMPRFMTAFGSATAFLIVAAVGFGLYINQPGSGRDPSPTPAPSPTAAALPSTSRLSPCDDSVQPEAGTVLGCSRDGTRVLIQKGRENLFIRHADGSETQVTEQLTGITLFPGSGRPAGATISPDGSRIVFAGLTKPAARAAFCHDGALFAVDADSGPAEMLWKSQDPPNGIVNYPTFSPDGTQIAFVDGYCDSDHSVWVMNANGSNAHQIVSSDMGPLGATHVHGLAWSPAGDLIALQVDQGTFSFATDGSAFQVANGSAEFCWPGRQCSAGLR